jgi:outer membrane protein OmpA-like peptidoglycan-associated protein
MWNGKSPEGELVQAASDYKVTYWVRDALGNAASVQDILPVDVLVMNEGDRLRIQVSSIYFAPFSTQFQPGKEADNRKTLARIAEILKKYGQYKITLEGHAVRIFWWNEKEGMREEKEELLPLSTGRAETVKKALVGYGINASRMTTIGYGGTRPVVPHSDLTNRWKSRRVEFILRQ